MVMTGMTLLHLVPIGETNAVSSRVIWERHGIWALSGVKGKLNEMVSVKLINRKHIKINGRLTSVYFRTPKYRDQ